MINITPDFAAAFAEEWISSWNSHDINKILSHYADDFTIESGLAAKLVPASKGRVVGREAVKKYWTLGLSLNKNLAFKLLDVLSGINGLTIYYINMANQLKAVEIMMFNEAGKVQKAFVHHSGNWEKKLE